MLTYGDVYELFKKETGIQEDSISDYRPCTEFYDVPSIPNAIVVWLESGNKLIFIAKDKESRP